MRILYKLLLSFFAMVLIIGVTSFIVVRASHRALRKEIGETAVAMTVQIVREMDKRIFERIDHFQEFIVSKYLRDMVARSNRDFEKMDNVQGFIDEKDHEWTSVPRGTITPFMQKLLENDLSNMLRKKMEFYNDEYNYKVYEEVFVTNKFGANVAQTGKTSDYRQDDEEWWQSGKRDNFYMKDIAYDESAGVHSPDIALRIDDEKGSFIGVIKIVLNIEDTFQYMRQSAVSERYRDVKFILTTKQGKNIYSAGGGRFLKDLSKDGFFMAAKDDMGFFAMSEEKSGQDGDLFAYARSKGFGWILFSEYKSEEIFAPLNRLNKRLSVLAVGIFFLSLILSYLISKTISRPIERLKIAAHDIGDGKLETKIDVHTKDEIGELASVLGRMTDELKHLATTDHLTQTYNRVKFEEMISMEMDRARRYHRFLSVSVFDIDYFKKVNDTYGHSAGDHVLKTMADIVKKNIRKSTYLFRWGGEEFVIIIPEADVNGAGMLAERIRKTIEDYKFEGVGRVTVSFGITQFKDEDTVDSLLKRADAAVYLSKTNGRNRIEIS
ncbi:MAG: diguanylate cyclase [Nitrospirae bacterium]|nr:diguanylate cyclase [Nitrospirota bacterium]